MYPCYFMLIVWLALLVLPGCVVGKYQTRNGLPLTTAEITGEKHSQQNKPKSATNVAGRIKMTQGQLGLSDEEFWTDPFKTRDDIEDKLLDEESEGFILDAPTHVPLAERDTFPVVLLRVSSLQNMRELVFRRCGLVVAIDITNNYTYANKAIQPRPNEPRPRPPSSAGPPPQGFGGEAFCIDIRKSLDLPWKPREYIVTVILRDQVSNQVLVKLVDTGSGYQDPEVASFIEEHRKKTGPPPMWPEPGDPLPGYEKQPSSPAIPEEPGVVLSVERVTIIKEGISCVLHGSFRLPVESAQIVQPSPQQSTAGESEQSKPVPSAIVPITLVLTGSVVATPFIWRLMVPSFDPISEKEETKEVTGYFAIDLCTLGTLTGLHQTYFIYAFSREVMTGPVPMAFISEDQLAP